LETHHGLRHGAGAQGQGDGTQGGADKCRGSKFHGVSNGWVTGLITVKLGEADLKPRGSAKLFLM
jgi:hypothetical protein